jgi:hypothetical protein
MKDNHILKDIEVTTQQVETINSLLATHLDLSGGAEVDYDVSKEIRIVMLSVKSNNGRFYRYRINAEGCIKFTDKSEETIFYCPLNYFETK